MDETKNDNEPEQLLEPPPEEKLIEPPEADKLISDHSVSHNNSSIIKIVIGIFVALVIVALAAIAYTTFSPEPNIPDQDVIEETNVPNDDFEPLPDFNPPSTDEANTIDDQIFCTMDALICPDGSSVGRIPPDCEFAACPGEQ